MSTIVYHHQQQQLLGFQPRHETHHHHQVVEPSWSLSLKLNPPKHHQHHQIESTLKSPLVSSNSNNNYNTSSSSSGSGGWTSIQSLTPSVNYSKDEVYVHPLTKRSSSKLSDKSLEMCTENLGCETGTDIIHSSSSSSSSSNSSFLFSFTALSKPSNNQDSSSSSSLAAAAVSSRQVMKRSHSAAKKTHSLPPPLTSMTGSTSLRVRPHRESGRLVMTAVSTSPRISNIQAERSNGRLTMCLVMDNSQESTVFPYNGTTTTTTGEPAYCTDRINESDLVMKSHETDKCHVRCKQDEREEEEDDDKTIKQLEVIHNHIGISNSKEEGDEEEEDDKSGVHVVETDKQEEEASVDWRIVGVDQLQQCNHQWPTRCNQNGGRGSNTTNCTTTLINWEPFWVTT